MLISEAVKSLVLVPKVGHMTERLCSINSLVFVECSLVCHVVQISKKIGLIKKSFSSLKYVGKVHSDKRKLHLLLCIQRENKL